jgi:hypothetical protein
MIKKNLIILLLCMSCYNLSAQSKIDIDYIFKMKLFLNKENVFTDKANPVITKGDSLFRIFNDLILLKVKELNLYNNLEISCQNNYKFYSVKESQITYARDLSKQEVNYFGISSELSSNNYVISVNKQTGYIYRLAGFDTNDFLGFLADYKEMYLKCNSKKLKTSTFLKNFKVEGLDFDCLYEGLRKDELDRKKYTCLYRCNESISFH